MHNVSGDRSTLAKRTVQTHYNPAWVVDTEESEQQVGEDEEVDTAAWLNTRMQQMAASELYASEQGYDITLLEDDLAPVVFQRVCVFCKVTSHDYDVTDAYDETSL